MKHNNAKPLNKLHLQLIAIIAMTIDHVAWLVFPGYSTNPVAIIMHIIGRLAFPIMHILLQKDISILVTKRNI